MSKDEVKLPDYLKGFVAGKAEGYREGMKRGAEIALNEGGVREVGFEINKAILKELSLPQNHDKDRMGEES